MREMAKNLAMLRYAVTRSRVALHWDGVAFNGQCVRRCTVESLIEEFDPDLFVETGTYLGDTTRFFAAYRRPVYTIEIHWTTYLSARLRLRKLANVRCQRGSSQDLIADIPGLECGRTFAYLDAHWLQDLPLRAELDALLTRCSEVLIVIDDFKVPGDPGYGFDKYGETEISEALVPKGLLPCLAYPAPPAADESGACRGTAYLARGNVGESVLAKAVARGVLRWARSRA